MKKNNYKKGFTLIELLVVVLIIGILASIAVPQYQLAVEKAKYTKYKPFVESLAQAQEEYFMANGFYAGQLDELTIDVPSFARSCSREYRAGGYDRFVCRPNATQFTLWGMCDGPSNAQGGDEQVRYLRFFRNTTSCPAFARNCQGRRHCWSKTNLGAKICKSLRGNLLSSNATWKYFELPE